MEQIHEFQILEWQKVIMVVIQLLLLAYYTCFRCSLKTNSLFVVFLFFCGSFSDLSDLLLGNNTIAKVYQIGMLKWNVILLCLIGMSTWNVKLFCQKILPFCNFVK